MESEVRVPAEAANLVGGKDADGVGCGGEAEEMQVEEVEEVEEVELSIDLGLIQQMEDEALYSRRKNTQGGGGGGRGGGGGAAAAAAAGGRDGGAGAGGGVGSEDREREREREREVSFVLDVSADVGTGDVTNLSTFGEAAFEESDRGGGDVGEEVEVGGGEADGEDEEDEEDGEYISETDEEELTFQAEALSIRKSMRQSIRGSSGGGGGGGLVEGLGSRMCKDEPAEAEGAEGVEGWGSEGHREKERERERLSPVLWSKEGSRRGGGGGGRETGGAGERCLEVRCWWDTVTERRAWAVTRVSVRGWGGRWMEQNAKSMVYGLGSLPKFNRQLPSGGKRR